MKEFTTAVTDLAQREKTDDDWPLAFKLDGRVMHFRKPTPGEGVILIAALAQTGSALERFGTYLDLFNKVLRPDDKEWWTRRILNDRDPLCYQAPALLAGGENGDGGLLRAVVEAWGADPTQGPEPSSPTPPQPGSGSTPDTPPSTYSAYHYPSSSTSSTSTSSSAGSTPSTPGAPSM